MAEVVIEVPEKYSGIAHQVKIDLETLVMKNEAYGDSWKRRGGRGAWFTLVRPWDRLEQMVINQGDNIFDAGAVPGADEDTDILDSIRDIRNYLYLIEDEIKRRRNGG